MLAANVRGDGRKAKEVKLMTSTTISRICYYMYEVECII